MLRWNISEQTVKNHFTHIYEKAWVPGRKEFRELFLINLCENGSDYNETNDKCSSFDEFEKLFGKDNSIFFELLFPIVQFQPTEEEMPLLILYQAYYYLFTKYSNNLE